jgi:L-ascorbate metabolism protein UlaG (beta-lactamase superfamily)
MNYNAIAITLLTMAMGFSAVSAAAQAPEAKPAETVMEITWWGHSTFVLRTSSDLTVLLDPAGKSTGYAIPAVADADLVTVSHEHSDHNYAALATGTPLVLRGLAGNDWAKIDQTVKGVRVRTVATYHDDTQGSQRGKNAIFVFELPGLRLAHLGDLGLTLSQEQLAELGPVDVILIPVGGFYTIDAAQAAQVVAQLKPRIVIPMHYKTADLSASLAGRLAGVEAFAAALGADVPKQEPGQTVAISASSLPDKTTLLILKYK